MKQMNVVLIGGGTGLSVLARGLREFPIDITAIVTVADNGGSTGKIRDVMDIPAPGDIRNVIAALSDSESILTQLFQYRFGENQVDGHSLGNLVIAGMTNITNDFGHAIKELSKVLNIKGQVIPSTNASVQLNAMEDVKLYMEKLIYLKHIKNRSCVLEPSDVEPMNEAIEALEQADLIVLGPGSLYTSVISNLCVKGISEALLRTSAPKLYVSNVMTQPGETDNYDVKEHIDALTRQVSEPFIDFVICSSESYSKDVLQRYEEKNSKPVAVHKEQLKDSGIRVLTASNLVEISNEHYVRHNTKVLSKMIYELALELTSTIRFTLVIKRNNYKRIRSYDMIA